MMTNTIELMLQHRSIRQFTDKPVPDDILQNILKATQAAATSSFQQCVSMIQINDAAKRAALVEITGNQRYVGTAPRFFIFCADFYRHIAIAPDGKVGFIEQLITASIDAGLMAQNTLLAAQSYGLGGVYIGAIRNHPKQVCELLSLPKHVFPLFGLCLGFPASIPELKPRIPQSMFLHQDHYQPFTAQDLQDYDQHIADYYRSRSSNQKDVTWSSLVKDKLSQESRPFMQDCLNQQGFAEQ